MSLKNLFLLEPTAIDSLYIFLTGNAGCGKSFLREVLYQSLFKTFSFRNSELEKTRVVLLVPTVVAPINIVGTTIHTGLNVPVGCFGKHLPPLSDKMRSMLRYRLFEVKIIIIDEVSIVSNDLLLHIHLRLTEILASKGTFLLQESQSLQLDIFYNCHQLELYQFTLNIISLGIIWIHCEGFLK